MCPRRKDARVLAPGMDSPEETDGKLKQCKNPNFEAPFIIKSQFFKSMCTHQMVSSFLSKMVMIVANMDSKGL